jgi:hypothetical protein
VSPRVNRFESRFIPNPFDENLDGQWAVYETIANIQIAHCGDLNWARWISRALNEAAQFIPPVETPEP